MTQKEAPVTQDLRDSLKMLMQEELENLPELLKDLEPKDRLQAICKLMPYVFPRIVSVPQVNGEPFQFL